MHFQTWLDLLLVKQLSWREARRLSTKPRDKLSSLSLNSIPTRDGNETRSDCANVWWSYDYASRRDRSRARPRRDLLDANQALSNLYLIAYAINGGATRDRTADLLDANQALSQLSYSPSLTCLFSTCLRYAASLTQSCT